jgi:hypothetical protein
VKRIPQALIVLVLLLSANRLLGQALVETSGYLRGSVAAFEEPERTKALAFLDEARKVSDAAARGIAAVSGQAAERAPSLAAEALPQWKTLREALAARRERQPGLTLQYRNQALELVGDPQKETSRVWYALVLPGPSVATDFISFVVAKTPGGHAGSVIAVDSVTYPADHIPPWMARVDGTLD